MRDSFIEALSALPHHPYRKMFFVTHNRPDTDALACLWLATKYLLPEGVEPVYGYVDAGQCLSLEAGAEGHVFHFDTGRGPFDQHGKKLQRSSSTMLLAKSLGVQDEPGLRRILDLTVRTDNIEEIDETSVHYVYVGLFKKFAHLSVEDRLDEIRSRAFEDFDIFFGQDIAKAKADAEFAKTGKIETLSNGMRVAFLENARGRLQESAYRAGADVAVWARSRKGGRCFYGIQVRRRSRVDLRNVVAALRCAEARERGIVVPEFRDATAFDVLEGVPGWFLHDSKHLILCGSDSADLPAEECSILSPRSVRNIAYSALARMSFGKPVQADAPMEA